MKIHSRAQLAMFQRAADDAAYARVRGITQDLAQQHLDAHEKAGSPDLPERAVGRVKPEARKVEPRDVRPLFLNSMRA